MQITVKTAKVLKRGANDYGEWALVKVVTDKDVEWTTLAKEADGILTGMVLAIDKLSIDEKDGKEKRSFKEFEIISAPAPSGTAHTGATNGMTPEAWAEKDKLERWSRECNTCFMGIMELAASSTYQANIEADRWGRVAETLDAALDWAMAHFQTTKPAPKPSPAPTKSTGEASVVDLDSLVFKDAGELKTACKDHLKMSGVQIQSETAGFDLTTEKGRKEAWEQIVAVRKQSADPDKLFD